MCGCPVCITGTMVARACFSRVLGSVYSRFTPVSAGQAVIKRMLCTPGTPVYILFHFPAEHTLGIVVLSPPPPPLLPFLLTVVYGRTSVHSIQQCTFLCILRTTWYNIYTLVVVVGSGVLFKCAPAGNDWLVRLMHPASLTCSCILLFSFFFLSIFFFSFVWAVGRRLYMAWHGINYAILVLGNPVFTWARQGQFWP